MILLKIHDVTERVSNTYNNSEGLNFDSTKVTNSKMEVVGDFKDVTTATKVAQEEQNKHKGNAKFILLNGSELNVKYTEPKQDWKVSIDMGTYSSEWEQTTIKNKTKKEVTKLMEGGYYREWCFGWE